MERSGVRNVKKTNAPKGGGGRRSFRKRRGKRNITYGDIGNKVYNDVMPVIRLAKKMFNTENKYLDTANSAAVSSTGGLTLLNAMAQGNTASTRLGDTVRYNFIEWNFVVTINAAATASQLRLCIFRDEQPNGQASPVAGYMANPNSVVSMVAFTDVTRFHTFVDEIIEVSSAGPATLTLRGSKGLGFHTNYGLSNNGNVTDISKNSLNLFLVSNEATNTVSVNYYIRLLFVDN